MTTRHLTLIRQHSWGSLRRPLVYITELLSKSACSAVRLSVASRNPRCSSYVRRIREWFFSAQIEVDCDDDIREHIRREVRKSLGMKIEDVPHKPEAEQRELESRAREYTEKYLDEMLGPQSKPQELTVFPVKSEPAPERTVEACSCAWACPTFFPTLRSSMLTHGIMTSSL